MYTYTKKKTKKIYIYIAFPFQGPYGQTQAHWHDTDNDESTQLSNSPNCVASCRQSPPLGASLAGYANFLAPPSNVPERSRGILHWIHVVQAHEQPSRGPLSSVLPPACPRQSGRPAIP